MADLDLVVEQLRGGYDKKEVLHGVDFAVQTGEVLCLLGPNGCGKSTLLKLLLGFLPRMGGRISSRGRDIAALSRRQIARTFAYIPQSDRMMFPYTVLEMVMMGRTSYISAFETPREREQQLALQAMRQVGIEELGDTLYTALSGGQRQLVLIARALCQNTCILVMDEPTASLDFANQKMVLEAVSLLAAAGKIVVITTHSPSQPFAIASKVLLLQDGHTVGFGSPAEVLTDDTLEQVYGLPMEVVAVQDRNHKQHQICLSL